MTGRKDKGRGVRHGIGDRWADAGSALSAYDAVDLAATVGALQIVPENAGRLYGLEAAASVVAGLNPVPRRPPMSTGRWRKLLDDPDSLLATGHAHEDPFENPFVDEVVVDGQAYRFLPGLEDEATFVLRHLVEAVRLLQMEAPSPFVDAARRLIHAALAVGDEVCQRAHLPRGCPPGVDFGEPLRIPAAPRLAELKRAVTFGDDEFFNFHSRRGVEANDLLPLVADQGDAFPVAYWGNGEPALGVPIAKSVQGHVIVGPLAITLRLRHGIVCLADNHGVTDALAAAYRTVVLNEVIHSLNYLGMDLVDTPVSIQLPTARAVSAFFSLDADKVAHALVIPDDLRGYDRDDPMATWPLAESGPAIREALAAADEFAFATQPQLRSVLHLVVPQGIGRLYALSVSGRFSRSRRLLLTAADLTTLGIVEGGSRLRLWQFAEAASRLRETTRVVRVSALDEYERWRSQGYGFYFGDGERPNHVSILPGGAGELRREVQRQCDLHGALDPDTGGMIEVRRLNGDPELPFYFPWLSGSERVRLLAEVPSGPYWIVCRDHDSRYRHLYVDVAEMVAYWLWQCGADLVDPSAAAVVPAIPQVIQLELEPGDAWFARGGDEGEAPPFMAERTGSTEIRLLLRPSAADTLATADNVGERELLRTLLPVLGKAPKPEPAGFRRVPSAAEVEAIIERRAPLGRKKKLFFVPGGYELNNDRGLPAFRPVQETDEEAVLDEIGQFVRTRLGLPVGLIDLDRRNEVLKEVVGFLFGRIEELVASVSPDGLLEWLVEDHEATLAAQQRKRLTTPTQLACFGASPLFAERLRRGLTATAQAATASRVLIEYVAARPPSGDQPFSQSILDRLLSRLA